MAQIDLGEVAEKEIAKRDRLIERLDKALKAEVSKNLTLTNTLKAMSKAKEALLAAADHLDPFRYDDD